MSKIKKKRRKRGSGSVFKRRNSWFIAFYYGGKQIREKVGSVDLITKGQAEQALKARMGEIVQGRFNLEKTIVTRSFFQLIDRYLKYASRNHRSFRRTFIACNHFKKYFGNTHLSDISTLRIENYIDKRLKDGVKKSTIHRELIVLSGIFTSAIDWGHFHGRNPVKRVKPLKTQKPRPRVLTNLEFTKLYDSASPHLKPILSCAYNTGMRVSEILELKWDDVNVFDEKLTVRKTKNYESRVIDINPLLVDMFIRLSVNQVSEYVFTFEGKPIKSVRRSFHTALKRSGIKYCRFHDLRHTFGSNLAAANVDIGSIMELMGHKTVETTKQYIHSFPEKRKEAVNKIAEMLLNTEKEKTYEEEAKEDIILN